MGSHGAGTSHALMTEAVGAAAAVAVAAVAVAAVAAAAGGDCARTIVVQASERFLQRKRHLH